jgi:hypothetical protein
MLSILDGEINRLQEPAAGALIFCHTNLYYNGMFIDTSNIFSVDSSPFLEQSFARTQFSTRLNNNYGGASQVFRC